MTLTPSQGFSLPQKRQILRTYTVLSGVLNAEAAGFSDSITIEVIKQHSIFECPAETHSLFNQHLYKVRTEKLIRAKKVNAIHNHYSSTPQGKKYYEQHTEVVQLWIKEGIGYADVFAPAIQKSALPKARMPDVPVSQSASRAIDSIGLIIDENRALHGFLKRLHVEIGQVLGQMNNNENDN